MFRLLREIEKETLSGLAARLLGELPSDIYRLFLNPLIFSEDGSDDYLLRRALLHVWQLRKDPDRFPIFRGWH